MRTRQNKDWLQLQLNFGCNLLSEVERRSESKAEYEALSQSFRRNIKADDTFPFWNALVGQDRQASL